MLFVTEKVGFGSTGKFPKNAVFKKWELLFLGFFVCNTTSQQIAKRF